MNTRIVSSVTSFAQGQSRQFTPLRPWFSKLTPTIVKADLMAGFTNAAIVLPQGVAFAIIAGLPPEYGLYTAMVVTVISAFWGASMVMVSGPTTAISAVMFASVSEFATPGTAPYIGLALTLTLMVGVIQLLAGLARLGSLISFVSHSVITGFTAAAALLIAASQLGASLGIATERGGGVVERLHRVSAHLDQINITAIIISGITLLVLLLLIRLDKRLPSYVLALAAGSIAGVVLNAADHGVAMFGSLDSVIPTFLVPNVSPDTLRDLLPSAFAIAFIGLLEAISIGKGFAMRRQETYDSNQEIIGQSLGNIVGSLFQSYAGSGSFTRSGLNAESGAQTPVAAISASAFLLILLVILAPFVSYVPVPAMATLILYVAWRLIDFNEIMHIIRDSRSETLIVSGTFLTGIFLELDLAVLVGVLLSLTVFLHKSANPIVLVGAPTVVAGRRVFMNAHTYDLDQCPQIVAMRFEGPLYFASVEQVAAQVEKLELFNGKHRTRLINLVGIGKIDLSGAAFLLKEIHRSRAQGVDTYLLVANLTILRLLERFHVLEALGEDHRFPHKSEAIAQAVQKADDDICRHCTVRIFHECAQKAKPQLTPDQEPIGVAPDGPV